MHIEIHLIILEITNHNLLKMKNILFILIALFTFNHSYSQEGNYITINFYKVADGKADDYEKLMTEYISKLQEARIKDGCLNGWVFHFQ